MALLSAIATACANKGKLLAIIAIGWVCNVNAQAVIMTTCAGTGASGNGGDGGPAIAARLSGPGFVATDGASNLYISDYSAHVVRKVNSAGIISTIAGSGTMGYAGDGGPATSATLFTPSGITLDNAGNLYIADEFNHVVRKVDASGIITTIAGNGVPGFGGDGGAATAAQLYRPTDVVIDHAGNIYISDNYNALIRKVDPSGTITTFAGVPGSAGYDGTGGPATAAKISGVFGIAIDNADNIYIAESFPQHVIRKISTTGIITLVAGDDASTFTGDGMAATATKMDGVADIAIDATGNIYLSEQSKSVIRKIGTNGLLTTIAGNGHYGFGGDGGAPIYATLTSPIGIALDNTGNIFIADESNSRVRKIGPATLGLDEQAGNRNLHLYPNPNNGTFTIGGIDNGGELTIQIKDITGRKVFEQRTENTTSMRVAMPETLPGGVYLLHATGTSGTKNFTFCIVR